jgi:hypothetical protein
MWRESTRSSIIVERSAVKIEGFLCELIWPTACISSLACFEGRADSEIIRLWQPSRCISRNEA